MTLYVRHSDNVKNTVGGFSLTMAGNSMERRLAKTNSA